MVNTQLKFIQKIEKNNWLIIEKFWSFFWKSVLAYSKD